MARARCSFTYYDAFQYRRVFQSRDIRHLAELISAETCWTLPDCILIAERLYAGETVVAADYETFIVPGDLTSYFTRPQEDRHRVAQRYAK